MKLKLLILLFLSLFVRYSDQGCLSHDNLTTLGFDEVVNPHTQTNPTYCTSLFANHGCCVSESSLELKIRFDTDSLTLRINIIGKLQDALDDIISSFKDDQTTQDDIEEISTNMEENHKLCIEAWSTIQQGATCLLASGAATEYTHITDSFFLFVDSAEIGKPLEKCLDFIDAICLITTGNSISKEIELEDKKYKSKENEYSYICGKLKGLVIAREEEDSEKLDKLIYKSLVEDFFRPYDYSFLPPIEKLHEIFENLSESIEDLFSRKQNKERRLSFKGDDVLLREPDNQENPEHPEEGRNIYFDGEKSGLKKVEHKSGYLVKVVFIGVLFMRFFK